MTNWLQSQKNPATFLHAIRTAAAAVVSFLIARLLRIPEPHWAAISTLVVVHPSFAGSLPISAQRFAGTAVGAAAGAIAATWFPGSWTAFGVAILALGAVAALLKADRAAYRYACITLVIVLLIPHGGPPWVAAVHRFLGVSLGIAVGVASSIGLPQHPND